MRCRKYYVLSVAALVAGSISLCGCTQSTEVAETSTDTATATTADPARTTASSATTTGSATPSPNSTAPAPTENKPDQVATNPGTSTTTNAASGQIPPGDTVSQTVNGVRERIRSGKVPDSTVILTVGGGAITYGDYRRKFNNTSEQIRAGLSINPQLVKDLINEAKANKIDLTPEERKKLVDTAHKAQTATGGVLKKYLQENKMTEAQFDQNVLDMGLAFKEASTQIEKVLLDSMVNEELLCQEARKRGFGNSAMNRFLILKKSNRYEPAVKESGLTPELFREQYIKDQLIKLVVEDLQKTAPASDKQIEDLYKQNKEKFKHGPRIKISQIVVAAPTVDEPPLESVKTQLRKSEPKLSDKELDERVKVTLQQLHEKALEVLSRAKKGEDFAALANQYTDDIPAKAAKNGGDIGWQEKSDLLAEFSKSVWPLKAGEVAPDLITSKFGYHIIKVTGKEGEGYVDLAEIKEGLRQMLSQNNSKQAVNDWLIAKRKATTVAMAPDLKLLSAKSGKPTD